MNHHELYMHRCLQLAEQGAGHVAPNPMVGAVLVHDERIIGEGYHRQYGEAHAEVNCINNVKEEDKHLIEESTLYVSLEPCAHYGKTPPCADLIIQDKIPAVVIGCRDPFPEVNGKGIEKLWAAGVNVGAGVLEEACKQLNKRFFTFHTRQRPYLILKWAQSRNHQIAKADFSKVHISNRYSNRLVHKWRSEEAAIMVGTNTALQDNPHLNVRHYTGKNPVRLVVDLNLGLPSSLRVFDKSQKTIIFNAGRDEQQHENLVYYKIGGRDSLVKEVLNACYKLQLQSVLIEGGNKLAETFINEGAWDEARVIENTSLIIDEGLQAPALKNHYLVSAETIDTDVISYYRNNNLL